MIVFFRKLKKLNQVNYQIKVLKKNKRKFQKKKIYFYKMNKLKKRLNQLKRRKKKRKQFNKIKS